MAIIRSQRHWEFDELKDGSSPGKLHWQYHTVTDSLTIHIEEEAGSSRGGPFPASARVEYFGGDRARATLLALLDWDRVFKKSAVLKFHNREVRAMKAAGESGNG